MKGIRLFNAIGVAVFTTVGLVSAQSMPDDLASGFQSPPDSAKPRTWWHWISGNVSPEGITADLESMKRVGLAGAQLFTVDSSSVKGPVEFMSADWKNLVHHALSEADRLHLEMSMEGCDGWSESGGPWIQPAQSMQQLVWTQIQTQGGQRVSLDLPQPTTVRKYYEDVAVFAFPTIAGDNLPKPVRVSASEASFDGSKTVDHDLDTSSILRFDKPDDPQWVQLEYAAPITCRSFRLNASGGHPKIKGELQTSDDGSTFKKVCDVIVPHDSWNGTLPTSTTIGFAPTAGRFFRLWIPSVAPKTSPLNIFEMELGGLRMDRLTPRAGMSVSLDANAFTNVTMSPQEGIDPKSLVDLTGRKDWDAPAGQWTIVRLGHTGTGSITHPAARAGLECDKLSAAAVEAQFQGMFGPVIRDSAPLIGPTLQYVLLDSWEAGCENWTPLMRAEFQERRGYDLGPWLPVLAGYIVENGEASQRFLWDYRRTLADLVAEKHYGTFQKLAHDHHMRLMAEATGIGMPTVADQLQCKGYTDVPMGEFWVNKTAEANIDDAKEAASAAHIYGQNIAATESFTSQPTTAAWKNDPYSLKALGDQEFCLGVNRFVFHRFAHQPWLDRKPGMSLGPYGINFERTNTWWEQSSAWLTYLSRCEYLLQQGKFAADFCYFYGEGAPVCLHHKDLKPGVPAGYDYDVCDAEILQRMKVENGRIVLPDGMSYRMLVLPDSDRMTVPILHKVKELVGAGALVYGPKPIHSPSLFDDSTSDQAIASISHEVWGPCDGKTITENGYGKGKILWGGKPLEQAVEVPPDFTDSTRNLLFIHRQDRSMDLYFVSNQHPDEIDAECTFRVGGKIPELWHPDTGVRETAALYKTENGLTTLPIHFDPLGSVFVVFRETAPTHAPIAAIKFEGQDVSVSGNSGAVNFPTLSEGKIQFTASKPGLYEILNGAGGSQKLQVSTLPQPLTLADAWQLSFPPRLGAPEKAVFDHLISWTDSPDDGIKYFSGTATYTQDFTLPDEFVVTDRRIYLDLGAVKNVAQVTLNGKSLGILWKPPFRADITAAARPGTNHLELNITNLWPNRLIGDQQLPENQRITWASVSLYTADSPLLPSGLLGPVTIIAAQALRYRAQP